MTPGHRKKVGSHIGLTKAVKLQHVLYHLTLSDL